MSGKKAILQRTNPDKGALLSNIALLYYGEGLTQGEIAKRFKVSRATIVNILRESRELGIVNIRVDGKYLSGSGLARSIREKFGLDDVYVAQAEAVDEAPRAQAMLQLAHVASTALLDIVSSGDRIGIAWGETIMAVAGHLPANPLENVEVCQLIGSMISDRVPASEICTTQIAAKLGAKCFTLHAPALISSADLALRLQKEPTIRAQLQRLTGLDLVVYSIGNVKPRTHLVAAGMATSAELAAAREAGAVGIVCCRYLDAGGNEITMPPSDRLITARMADLRSAKKRLLIVCGKDRSEATLAAIRGGLVTHLCVDHGLATRLVEAG